jgi:3-oxoacyl-[acyl-carrier-protein] synthase-3
MSCFITGYGSALPQRVVTNAEIAPMLGVTPDWIEANSGIRERRWVESDQAASDLAVAAVCDALNDAGSRAEDVDYLIGCTLSPDYQTPGLGPIVQRKLEGCRCVPAIDLRAGCAAILYCLQLARGLIESRAASTVVCFGAEAQSKGLDLRPRSADLSMLFGDGAGAVVVSGESKPTDKARDYLVRVDDILIETDGSFAEDLIVRAPGTANGARWLDESLIDSRMHYGSMQGRNVILQAVRKLSNAADRILIRNGLSSDQVELLIPHQANANLIATLARKLSIDMDRVVMNVDRLGNTSGASAFLALSQARREGKIRLGSRMLILAFGAGFTWGGALGQAVATSDQ